MKSKLNLHKPSIFLYFVIILAFTSVFFYEFVNFYYIYGAEVLYLASPFIFFIVILFISIVYFIIHYHLSDSGLFNAHLLNSVYFLSIGILFLFSLLFNPRSLMVVILVSILTVSGLGFIIFYLKQPRKDVNHNIETLKTKKVLINICLIIFFWVPAYIFIFISFTDMNTGIILIILGLGYFLYQKHDKLTLSRKFLGFLLIFIVVLSILPVINYRTFVRKNIEYKEIYTVEKTIPNSFISTVESFNYTYNYNWSTYAPKSDGSPNYVAYFPSDRIWFRNHIESLQHALFIPSSNFEAKFLYNLSAVSIKTSLNISYRYFGQSDNKDHVDFLDINASSDSSILYQSSYYSHISSNIRPCFIFLNHTYFSNPTNIKQEKEISNCCEVKIDMQYNQDWIQNEILFSSKDWTQNQLYFLDEYGNIICVIIYSNTIVFGNFYISSGCGRNLDTIY